MKIEKLYTLSQFVDYVDTEEAALNASNNHINYMFDQYKWELVQAYNKILKKPLTKEMFVNEIKKPNRDNYDIINTGQLVKDFENWKKAEKKVIFEGFEYNKVLNKVKCYNPYVDLTVYYMGNLSDLAEKTNGQLKLKNVEI